MYADSRAPAASTSSTVAGRRAEAGRHEHDRADIRAAEYRPRQRVPQRRAPPGGRHRSVPALPRRAALGDQALADAGDAHFLAGRRGGGDGEQVTRQPVGLRPTLLRGLARPPGRHVDVNTVGTANTTSSDQRRVNRHQQRHRHAQPQDPPERGEQRHVHVVEHEHLIAQHGQPIEILRAFLMRDRRDRCLQLRDVRLERDRHLVAEAALHARADGAEKPGRGGRHAEADRRALHQAGPVLERRPCRAASATARAAHRAARRAATARTRRPSGAARGDTRACTAATSTTARAAAARSRAPRSGEDVIRRALLVVRRR